MIRRLKILALFAFVVAALPIAAYFTFFATAPCVPGCQLAEYENKSPLKIPAWCQAWTNGLSVCHRNIYGKIKCKKNEGNFDTSIWRNAGIPYSTKFVSIAISKYSSSEFYKAPTWACDRSNAPLPPSHKWFGISNKNWQESEFICKKNDFKKQVKHIPYCISIQTSFIRWSREKVSCQPGCLFKKRKSFLFLWSKRDHPSQYKVPYWCGEWKTECNWCSRHGCTLMACSSQSSHFRCGQLYP